MTGMQVGYGAYRHPAGWAHLINFSAESRYSPRGFREFVDITAHVQGDICLVAGEDEYDVTTYINDLSAAFDTDGLDFGLYHSNGTPTAHFLLSSDPTSLTGNQVVYKSFPASDGGEYASGREFAYAIRNTFNAAETSLIEYQETVEQSGTGAAPLRFDFHNGFAPTLRKTAPAGVVITRHSGHAISLATWLDPPAPLYSWPIEDESARVVRRTGPRRWPQGFTGYRIDWSYTYLSLAPLPVLPAIL